MKITYFFYLLLLLAGYQNLIRSMEAPKKLSISERRRNLVPSRRFQNPDEIIKLLEGSKKQMIEEKMRKNPEMTYQMAEVAYCQRLDEVKQHHSQRASPPEIQESKNSNKQ